MPMCLFILSIEILSRGIFFFRIIKKKSFIHEFLYNRNKLSNIPRIYIFVCFQQQNNFCCAILGRNLILSIQIQFIYRKKNIFQLPWLSHFLLLLQGPTYKYEGESSALLLFESMWSIYVIAQFSINPPRFSFCFRGSRWRPRTMRMTSARTTHIVHPSACPPFLFLLLFQTKACQWSACARGRATLLPREREKNY